MKSTRLILSHLLLSQEENIEVKTINLISHLNSRLTLKERKLFIDIKGKQCTRPNLK